jgi:hypothetical protein
MMPHAIRRVYVARRARTAASISIALIGGAMLAIAAQPAWTQYLARGLPGINPAVLCTMIVAMWFVGALAYFAARAIDEHRFAVAMSRLVMPGKDVNADVERLAHENPDQAARDMAHHLEVRSAAWPVLAAGVLLPVTALYIAAAYRAGGWPVIAQFETSVAVHAHKLLACAGVASVLAIVMTKRAARLPVAVPTMMVLAAITGATALVSSLWLVPLALVVATVGLVVRRLRIERDLLQAEDPAAGSEIFTIRGFIRELRATASAALARVKQTRRRRVVIGATAVAIGGVMLMMPARPKTMYGAEPQIGAFAGTRRVVTPTIEPTGAKTSVESMGDGRLKITLDLVDASPVNIPALAGMRNVPPLWMARVKLDLIEGVSLRAGLFGDNLLRALSIGDDFKSTQSNCGIGELPLGLHFEGPPGHYVIYVEPALVPAGC